MQQTQVDWFESWFGSPYYPILYQNRDQAEAQVFVENLIAFLHPAAGSKMLDIACGEGRFAIQLAAHGFDVTGIDLSYASIEKALHHEAENLHFLVHDMRYPFYIRYFDFAFNFFTSFGYFATQRDNETAAKSFAKALKKEGTLVMDYLNKIPAVNALVAEEMIDKGTLKFHIRRELKDGHFLKHIQFVDTAGRERHFTESVAAFELPDFIRMFEATGLKLEHTFGDYQLNAYNPENSPRMIMVFKN